VPHPRSRVGPLPGWRRAGFSVSLRTNLPLYWGRMHGTSGPAPCPESKHQPLRVHTHTEAKAGAEAGATKGIGREGGRVPV
jgi:hypothetical protein